MDATEPENEPASDEEAAGEEATTGRQCLPLDVLCVAIVDRAIAEHETSDAIGARLSRARILPFLLAGAVECGCARARALPAADPKAGEKRSLVEIYPGAWRLLDEQIRKEEQDVRVAVRFTRPQMLRRLLLRAGRCICATARAGEGEGRETWQVPRT